MSKNYFKGIMRSMREFTAEMDSNKARYDRARAKAAEDYAEAKGSMLYDRVFSEVDNDFSTRRGATVEKYKKELISLLDGMRAEASTRVIKAPTTDMINNLTLLSDVEDLTPGTLNMYAKSMANCPLALQKLSQIAKKNGMQMGVSPQETIMNNIDRLEGFLAEYLRYYFGDLTVCPSIVTRDMWRYFQPEDTYAKGVKFDDSVLGKTFHSTEEVDKLFWSQFVGIGSPDLVSSTADDAPVVQYFFSSVEALSDFIEKAKKGLSEDKAKEVTESILHECPEQYRNVYDEFQRNGTVSDLNNFDESI
jgi:hypothetical protein